jgi:hypothetical protein
VATKVKGSNRRGSVEAVEKRRAGRSFNEVLSGLAGSGKVLDGRTEKRRQRMLKELVAGETIRRKPLKPLDILLRAQELLTLGETVASLREALKGKKRPRVAGPSVVDAVRKLHRAYGFRYETYRFVGIDDETLEAAGLRKSERARQP